MYIRCKSCHSAVWLELPDEANRTASASCQRCGQEYDFQSGRRPDREGRALARKARQLASGQGIDLPAAYSVVLGALTVEDVHDVQQPTTRGPVEPRRVEASPDAGADDESFDPEFAPAVRAGHLTATQAAQRGQRILYAEGLANRYGIAMATAYDVADNRVSLLRALRRNPTPAAAPVELAPTRRNSSTLYLALAGSAALLLFAVCFRPGPSVPDELKSATRTVGSAEVRTDAGGRIIYVSALDPRSVLDGYCSADTSGRLRPLGVVTGQSELRGARLGLFRRVNAPAEVLSIDIREDRRAQRWIAGDGAKPIVAVRAPAGAEEGIVNPTEARAAADVKPPLPASGAVR